MASAVAHKSKRNIVLAALLSLLLVIGIWHHSPAVKSQDSTLQTAVIPSTGDSNWRPWLKASKVRVSAVAFYGRRRYVRILDKYIKQNLISAGGLLEEVLWIVRTDDPDDLNWLEQTLLPSEPKCYKRMQSSGKGFANHYRQLASDTYYIKLDDDIVYIKEGAIEALLHEKLRNRFWIISANVINHSVLTFVHAAMGAMQTYHQEGEDFVANKMKPQGFLDGSPFGNMTYKPYDMCALRNFACVATCHYNFLDNLARDELYKYNFGTWDLNAFKYERWSINTIMFKGSDLNREVISEDDEQSISETLPKTKGKHCGAVGSAVVAHLAYVTQRGARLEERTQVLKRYEELAERLAGPLLPI
ncbi:TPA: hypothetical protein ACH3X1_003737 [Trebouxia sp. C0004]